MKPDYSPRPQVSRLFCLLLALLAMILPAATANNAGYGAAGDVARAEMLWPLLEARGLVGADPVQTQLVLAREPVGQLIETLGARLSIEGEERLAFVKRVYASGVSPAEIDADRLGLLVHTVAMIRAERGYNAQADDWFFVRYGPEGAILTDQNGVPEAGRLHGQSDIGCMACHRTAPGDDFLFTTDRPY